MTEKDQPNNGADTEAGNGESTDDLSLYTLTTAEVGRQCGVVAKTVRSWQSLLTTDPRHLPGEKMDGRWKFRQRDVDARKRRLLEKS